MPVKSFRPTTPTRRFQTVVSREEITKQKPEKSLVRGKPATGGRSSTGRISSRFRGGGHKKAYREIDFKRDKHGIVAVVAAIAVALQVFTPFPVLTWLGAIMKMLFG